MQTAPRNSQLGGGRPLPDCCKTGKARPGLGGQGLAGGQHSPVALRRRAQSRCSGLAAAPHGARGQQKGRPPGEAALTPGFGIRSRVKAAGDQARLGRRSLRSYL